MIVYVIFSTGCVVWFIFTKVLDVSLYLAVEVVFERFGYKQVDIDRWVFDEDFF